MDAIYVSLMILNELWHIPWIQMTKLAMSPLTSHIQVSTPPAMEEVLTWDAGGDFLRVIGATMDLITCW